MSDATTIERLFTVEECQERIDAAQWVLDHPDDYDVEVRVDADKERRRWRLSHAYAVCLSDSNRELDQANEVIALCAADTTAVELRQREAFVEAVLDRYEEINAARENPSQMVTDLIRDVRYQFKGNPC